MIFHFGFHSCFAGVVSEWKYESNGNDLLMLADEGIGSSPSVSHFHRLNSKEQEFPQWCQGALIDIEMP